MTALVTPHPQCSELGHGDLCCLFTRCLHFICFFDKAAPFWLSHKAKLPLCIPSVDGTFLTSAVFVESSERARAIWIEFSLRTIASLAIQ